MELHNIVCGNNPPPAKREKIYKSPSKTKTGDKFCWRERIKINFFFEVRVAIDALTEVGILLSSWMIKLCSFVLRIYLSFSEYAYYE